MSKLEFTSVGIVTDEYDSCDDQLIEWNGDFHISDSDEDCQTHCYYVDKCTEDDNNKEYDDWKEKQILEQIEEDEYEYMEHTAQETGIDFGIIVECVQLIKQMRGENCSEKEIYYYIKDKYSHHFYDVAFTLNTLLQIEHNSDDDISEASLTSGTTTDQSLSSSDCVESDHSSDMCD